MIGTTLAHYRITAALGAGGMGEVWRAEDSKLGRQVALKVLPEEFVGDPQRLERFEREARAVAALNHPSIVTIYSVEEDDDVRFITMELIEGRCLDQLIPEGGLHLDTFLNLATPLAEAMSAAHEKGVVHRDLKPSNVMVDGDNRLKVLDFGLAKLQDAEDVSDSTALPTEALTGVGTVVGTVPYMSPEQVEGLPVDHRTDIFSLGILLYEMATGVRPFQGSSSPGLMSSILRDVPKPIGEIRADLPRHLGRVIGRCLEKDRRDRYQTARDVFNELKTLRRESDSAAGTSTSRHSVEFGAETGVRTPTSASGAEKAQPSSRIDRSGPTDLDEGFWIAVLPFKVRGTESAIEALADGISEDIVMGLSRFSYLRVISRSSTLQFANESLDVRAVGQELGARYIMEGSIRQAGSVLRVAVQLVDADSGAHLWAETYNRPFNPDEIFELQDDIAPRIVSTIADMNGILPHTMSEGIRSRPVDELSPYEAMLRGFGYYVRLTEEDHAEARACLEKAVEDDPGNADCWALLSVMYAEEHKHGFNAKPDPLDRSLEAARQAVAVAPSNHFAHHSLAQALFFRRELQAFRIAADRAVALNPMDGCTTAFMGILMAYAGQWDEGCALAEQAMQLNPHHPGWYRFSIFLNAYRKGNYRAALDVALKINMPSYFFTHAALASTYGQLGDQNAARQAVSELLAQKPDFATTAREEWERWVGPGEILEDLLAGLRKAGLSVDGIGDQPEDLGRSDIASPTEEDRSVSIAVLPFVNSSDDPANEYFSDGLTEELIADLAGIKALSVISRTSAMLFKGTDKDLPTIGRELGARYVLEGSVRKAGPSLRITAQLIDAEKDTQLWSEKYSGTMDDIFEVQERVSREIVRALDLTLTSDENRLLAERPIADVRAFELYLQARQEIRRFDVKALDRAAKLVSQAVEIEGETPPLVFLAALAKVTQAKAGVNPDPHQLEEVEAQALELLEQMPDLPQAHTLLGSISYERGRLPEAVWHCNRALEGTSNDTDAFLYLSASYMAAGQPELGLDAGRRMVACDPLASISWMIKGSAYWFVGRTGEAVPDLERGLELDPQNFLNHWSIGYTYASLGRLAEAGRHAAFCVGTAPENAYTLQVASLVDALEGRREAALERLADVDITPLDAHNKFHLSESFAMAGDTRRALEILEIAVDQGFYPYPFINEYCPFMAPLRSLPEFAVILAKSKEKTQSFREDGPLRRLSQDAQGGIR